MELVELLSHYGVALREHLVRLQERTDRLSDLAVLSIEHELTRQIDFDDVIDLFATMKTRRYSF